MVPSVASMSLAELSSTSTESSPTLNRTVGFSLTIAELNTSTTFTVATVKKMGLMMASDCTIGLAVAWGAVVSSLHAADDRVAAARIALAMPRALWEIEKERIGVSSQSSRWMLAL